MYVVVGRAPELREGSVGNNFGDFSRSLRKAQREIGKKVERASADMSFAELFNASFMGRYTDFGSFEAMIEAGGWGPPTAETFKAIPDAEWEVWVQKHTRFSSWEQMQKKAAQELLAKRLR